MRHTSFYFALIHCASQILCLFVCLFVTDWRFVVCSSQIYQWQFSNIICSLCVSVSPFGNSCSISNFCIIIIVVIMISDQCSLMLLLKLSYSAMNHTYLYNTTNLIDKCVFWWLPWPAIAQCLFLLGPPHFLKYNNIKIRPINSLTTTCRCSHEMKSCTFLTLNQKLEMTKLSEEGVLKAEIGWNLDLSCQAVSQAVDAKEKF